MNNQPVKSSLRIAHITDCHVYHSATVISSMKRLLDSLQSMPDKPDIIINTGDSILDANFETLKKVQEQWQVWKELTEKVEIPIYSAIGNHDIWIPSLKRLSEITNPLIGKDLAIKMLGMPAPYYSFTMCGWKFIALNSVSKRYALNSSQFNWLKSELSLTNEPVCIFSHVPIVSLASFMYHLVKKRWWAFPRREMHSDTFKLQALFNQYQQVKICLSGHVHYIDDVEYSGVRYLCHGAVCGNWWKESFESCSPAYALIDLYKDGKIEKKVIRY